MGLANAFLDYSLTDGFFGHAFAGMKYFKELFSSESFYLAMKNTLGMSFLKFFFTFTSPLLLALIINEVPFKWLKKATQTGSYLPHFLSYVIVATLWIVFLDSKGLINDILMRLHITDMPIEFLADSKYFWWIGVWIDCWQESGWNAIIYRASKTDHTDHASVYRMDGRSPFRYELRKLTERRTGGFQLQPVVFAGKCL